MRAQGPRYKEESGGRRSALERDFVPLAIIAVSPNVIVGAPTGGATLKEVIERARGGAKLQFGSPGHGTAPARVLDYLAKVLGKVEKWARIAKSTGARAK